MAEINNGGSAFPLSDLSGYGMGPADDMSGMSLRDYFAAKAMCAFLSQSHQGPKNWNDMGHGWGEDCANDLNRHSSVVVDTLAGFSYRVADAMLKAREASHG